MAVTARQWTFRMIWGAHSAGTALFRRDAAEQLRRTGARCDALHKPWRELTQREYRPDRSAALDHLGAITVYRFDHAVCHLLDGRFSEQAIRHVSLLGHALVHALTGDKPGTNNREAHG